MPKRQRDSSISTTTRSSLPPQKPCPEEIRVWAADGGKTTDSAVVSENARNHLLATGCSFFLARKANSYRSPAGKVFYSLLTACKSLHINDVDNMTSPSDVSMETCPSRKRRKKRTRSIEDIMGDDRSFLKPWIDRVLGMKVPVTGRRDLSWTLLKSESQDNVAHNLKLQEAVEVMHQCFKPSKDPVTHKDVVEDIIFNGERGFYTVVLEKEDKVVTAANVRVHGVVAEVPLVATRFAFRRQGMLKAMMNGIENWLKDSGIERLVLPSAKSSLATWTSSSIGFSTMTEDEKADLLIAYDCLDFQDTTMCEKQLLEKKKRSQKGGDFGYSSDGSTISHEEYVL